MSLDADDLNEIRAIAREEAKKECENQGCGCLVLFFVVWFFVAMLS